jgi:hypothetical protein
MLMKIVRLKAVGGGGAKAVVVKAERGKMESIKIARVKALGGAGREGMQLVRVSVY